MKKHLLFLLFLCLTVAAYAQYGHRTYNADTISTEQFNDGFITDVLTSGGLPIYAAGGFITTPGSTGALITRSRFNRMAYAGGQLSGNIYYLFKSGPEVQSRTNSVCERGSAGYLMSGTGFTSSTAGNVLFLNANTTGALTAARTVDLTGFDEAFSTRRSLNTTNRYYTCGSSITTAGSVSEAFLMKHNETGATVDWVRRFNLQCNGVNRLAEAVAVIDDASTGNVVIIGNISFSGITGGCQQAFIARFTAAGALTWLQILNSTSLSSIQLQNIRATDSPESYVIVGSAISSSLPGRRQVLFIRVNTSSAAMPTNSFVRLIRTNGPTPNFPVQHQIGYDVVSRKDSLGAISYYIAGSTQYSTGTSTDGLLIRTNSSGNPVNTREYFGDGSEVFYAIDLNQTVAGGRGLAAFGAYDSRSTSTLTRRKSWLAKTYFNLVSGCKELVDSGLVTTPGITYAAFTPQLLTTFTRDSLTYQSGTTTNQIVCWNTVIAGGSILREMNHESTSAGTAGTLKAQAYPNPVTGAEITLQMNSEQAEIAEVVLTDLSGRFINRYTVDLAEGENAAAIQVADLKQGAYLIRIVTASGQTQVIRFIRQ